PHSLHISQAAGGEAHRLGDFLCDLDITGVEIDVIGDKKFARAHNRGASGRMNARLAEIRAARRIGGNLLAYAFELPATDILQVLALGRSGRSFVQVNGNLEALPNL